MSSAPRALTSGLAYFHTKDPSAAQPPFRVESSLGGRIGITAVPWLIFVPSMLARGEAGVRSTQDQIKTLEQRWANTAVRADVSEVSTYEADDVVFIRV